MIDRLALAGLCLVILGACDAIERGQPSEAPAAVTSTWQVSGSCQTAVSCTTGETLTSSCPETSVSYCQPGAACNPADTAPCVIARGLIPETAACGEPGVFGDLHTFDVLACSPNGTLQPAP